MKSLKRSSGKKSSNQDQIRIKSGSNQDQIKIKSIAEHRRSEEECNIKN
jgi:hypothetical protein